MTWTPPRRKRPWWNSIGKEKLSHGKLAEGLGISRYETDAVLKQHNVTEDLLSREDFDRQVRELRKLLGQ